MIKEGGLPGEETRQLLTLKEAIFAAKCSLYAFEEIMMQYDVETGLLDAAALFNCNPSILPQDVELKFAHAMRGNKKGLNKFMRENVNLFQQKGLDLTAHIPRNRAAMFFAKNSMTAITNYLVTLHPRLMTRPEITNALGTDVSLDVASIKATQGLWQYLTHVKEAGKFTESQLFSLMEHIFNNSSDITIVNLYTVLAHYSDEMQAERFTKGFVALFNAINFCKTHYAEQAEPAPILDDRYGIDINMYRGEQLVGIGQAKGNSQLMAVDSLQLTKVENGQYVENVQATERIRTKAKNGEVRALDNILKESRRRLIPAYWLNAPSTFRNSRHMYTTAGR